MDRSSREALAELREGLAGVPDDAVGAVAGELLAVAGLLDGAPNLRRALTDTDVEAPTRTQLMTRLFEGKVSATTLGLLQTAAGRSWSRQRDLADGIDQLGAEALLAAAQAAGRLDDVEDQVFRFGRIVDREPALSLALGDPAAPAEAKRALLHRLLEGKVDDVARQLLEQAVLFPRGRSIERAVVEICALAARRRDRLVATVRVARPLADGVADRLADSLRRVYGAEVAVQVDVDPRVLGGMSVLVGDELIDGTVLRRLADARTRLTR